MSSSPHGNGGGSGYERRDVVFRPIILSGVALFVLVVVAFVGMRWLFEGLASREAARSEVNPLASRYARELPPLPRLQADPIEDLEALRHAEEAVLSAYAWVDREAGVVRVPIDRALELLARRGLPARPSPAGGGR